MAHIRRQSPKLEEWLALAGALGSGIQHRPKTPAGYEWWCCTGAPHPWGPSEGWLTTLELRHGAPRAIVLCREGSLSFTQFGFNPGEDLGPFDENFPFRRDSRRIVLFVTEATLIEPERQWFSLHARVRIAIYHARTFSAVIHNNRTEDVTARQVGWDRLRESVVFYRNFMASHGWPDPQKATGIPTCDLFNRLEAWVTRRESI